MLAHAGSVDESLSVLLVFGGLWVGWVGWSRLRDRGFPRLSRGGAVACVAVGFALAVSAAVVPQAIFPPTPPVRAAPASDVRRPSSTGSLSFSEPVAGGSARGGELDVVLDLEGGRVVDAASTNLTPDTGHIHLSLDGRLVSMTYGLVQVVDLRDLAPGDHVLEAEFVAADHAPFDPPVTTTVRFETGTTT